MKLLTALAKLANVRRTTIYAVLFVAAGLPFVVPIRMSPIVWNETHSAFELTDATPPDKVLAINSQWIAGSQGENWPEYEAIVSHCMLKGIKFVVFGLDSDPLAPQMAEAINEKQAAQYGRKYGVDWVNLGLSRGAPLTMAAIGRNVKSVYRTDFRGTATDDFRKLPLMRQVVNAKSFQALWVVDYQPNLDWTVFLDPRGETPILFASAGMVSTGYYPYIASKQLKGMLVGVRGAAEYETLLREKYGDRFIDKDLRGGKLLVPLAFGHLVIILFIVAGNIGILAARRLKKSHGPDAARGEKREANEEP